MTRQGRLTSLRACDESSRNLEERFDFEEDDDFQRGGDLNTTLIGVTPTRPTADGNTGQGIDFDENSTGDLTAPVSRGSSSNNGGAGVRADQQLPGIGSLNLTTMALTGNTGGAVVVANAGVTVTQTP